MHYLKFLQLVDKGWADVSTHVKDAFVLMDSASAECLHWHGGLTLLLNNGAAVVENFSPFVTASSSMRKAVFILSSPFDDETMRTLMIVIRSNSFQNCVVLSSLPPKCYAESKEEGGFFTVIERRLMGWMGNTNCTASVRYVPITYASISPSVFFIPFMAGPFSVSCCSLLEMNSNKTEPPSSKHLPSKMLTSIKNLSYSFVSMLDALQMRGDFFSMGPLSHFVCSDMESISQAQKMSFTNKASVVVIDRLLDLAGPLSQSYDTMLDKIMLALPHIDGHHFDVCVSMKDFSACKENSVFGRHLLAPGCLSHKNNSQEEAALNAILSKKPREVLIELNRLIVDCAGKEGINLDLNSRLTSDVLKQRILAFKQKQKAFLKYNGLLQQVLGVIQALEFSTTNDVDNLSAVEKALIEYLVSSHEEVLENLMQMVAEKDEMNYKMENILCFLAFFYMISGADEVNNEAAMQATLMETFFQENMQDLLNLFVEKEDGDECVLNAVRTFFDVLKRLCITRKKLKRYSNIFKSTNPAFPATYSPLLKQLLEDMFDQSLPDIPDLEFHSTGIRDYLKTGFSLFMNVTKPQPRDNPVIYLIILGGVTASEIKMVQEMSFQKKGIEIFLGSTAILTPFDMLKELGLVVKELSEDATDKPDV